jgi:hypothetical protein
MAGKLSWYQSVTAVDLTGCEHGVCGPLAELRSMPSLCSLTLPASCAERAVDAEAVYGLTTLRFSAEYDEDGDIVEVGEWVLDLSRLMTLTTLDLESCIAVADKEVLALSNLTGLKDLNLSRSNVTSEGLRVLSSLTALTSLNLAYCDNGVSKHHPLMNGSVNHAVGVAVLLGGSLTCTHRCTCTVPYVGWCRAPITPLAADTPH